MESELLEKMAALVHDGWLEEKKRQGFHHPSKCDDSFIISEHPLDYAGTCSKCHSDMKPYSELSENVKELDRVMVRQFEKNLEDCGYAIGIDATK